MSKVGIFWYVKNTLVFKAINIDKLTPDELGKIDSPFTHIEEWETHHIFNQFGLALFETEYQNYPRGRVVFDTSTSSFHVFIDKSIFKALIKQKIIEEFQLHDTAVKWFDDLHYRVYSF